MVLRTKPAGTYGQWREILRAGVLVFGIGLGMNGWGQNLSGSADSTGVSNRETMPAEPGTDALTRWEGMPVRRISFEGVTAQRLTPLAGHLALAEGAPLRREDVQ